MVAANQPVSSSSQATTAPNPSSFDDDKAATGDTTDTHRKSSVDKHRVRAVNETGEGSSNSNEAAERSQNEQQKQVEDSRQTKRNRKRWVRQLLLQEHIEQFVLLDGLLPHLWKRDGRPSRRRKSRANVLAYLENDDRRVVSLALEPATTTTTTTQRNNNKNNNNDDNNPMVLGMMMSPLYRDQDDDATGLTMDTLFEGMVLQVDDSTNAFYQSFQEQLEIPICRDMDTTSSVLYAIDTYQLLEPLHKELGLTSKHAIDFAYTPVEFSEVSPPPIIRNQQHHSSLEDNHHSQNALVNEQSQYNNKGPTSGRPWWKWWFPRGGNNRNSFWKGPDEKYKMSETAFAGGSHGEVWRGRRLCRDEDARSEDDNDETCRQNPGLIFKRLKVEHGYRLLEAGLREVYVGKRLAEDPLAAGLFTTYVNHFFREVPKRSTTATPWSEGENDLELWIVFQDAGPSMRSYLYSPVSNGDFVLYQHSYLWTKLRQNAAAQGKKEDNSKSVAMILDNYQDEEMLDSEATINGKNVMKEVLRQLLTCVAFLHERGIVHRDIKPSNFMCKTNLDLDTLRVRGGGGDEDLQIHCSLGDFSSVYDSYTDSNLYTHGPTTSEVTIEYAPPETVLGSQWKSFSKQKPQSYDSWSIGVLALELLLGTPNVFSVDQRTTALLTNKMQNKGASEKETRRALYLAALSQFCIYMPASAGSQKSSLSWPLRQGDPLYKIAMVKESCTLRDFHQALRARDPLGLGFDRSTDQLLQLIWQLLAWDPLERISAADALQHPYFTNITNDSEPGDHNAVESQMLDPRLDFNLRDSVDEFACPKCGRVFSDWKSCHQHANARKHAKFCSYDKSKLPSSVNAHSMLPAHPNSGYFDIQGRRPTIEDFHSIHLLPSSQFYGVFDGHTGNLASKFVASALYEQLTDRLSDLDIAVRNSTVGWKESVESNVTEVLSDLHQKFLNAVNRTGHGAMDKSGTTVTAVYVTDEAVIIASLGDSRAILSSASAVSPVYLELKAGSKRQKRTSDPMGMEMSAIQLTKDHVASDPEESAMVRDLGGSVSIVNGLARVNGVLAITRSIGDAPFATVLSRTPNVVSFTRAEIRNMCGSRNSRKEVPCFIVLASDGLWDMVSNQEAIDMVAHTVASYQSNSTNHDGGAFQEASKVLTLEAYVRGSTDNIGVCVISLN